MDTDEKLSCIRATISTGFFNIYICVCFIKKPSVNIHGCTSGALITYPLWTLLSDRSPQNLQGQTKVLKNLHNVDNVVNAQLVTLLVHLSLLTQQDLLYEWFEA